MPRAVHRGNYGLMQIRLGTARGVGYSGDAQGPARSRHQPDLCGEISRRRLSRGGLRCRPRRVVITSAATTARRFANARVAARRARTQRAKRKRMAAQAEARAVAARPPKSSSRRWSAPKRSRRRSRGAAAGAAGREFRADARGAAAGAAGRGRRSRNRAGAASRPTPKVARARHAASRLQSLPRNSSLASVPLPPVAAGVRCARRSGEVQPVQRRTARAHERADKKAPAIRERKPNPKPTAKVDTQARPGRRRVSFLKKLVTPDKTIAQTAVGGAKPIRRRSVAAAAVNFSGSPRRIAARRAGFRGAAPSRRWCARCGA